tara:strand:- start:1275 stop:3962 length:2688 start_codon:yes stop_codon:yes gene_type:complete
MFLSRANVKNIKKFLRERSVKKSDVPDGETFKYTHLSMSNPKCSYFIKDEDIEEFHDLYYKAVFEKKQVMCIVEKHNESSQLLIDLDLRFDMNDNFRKYTADTIIDFIRLYMQVIEKYVNITDERQRHAYIFEKSKPAVDMKKNVVKDGIHIMFPYLVVNYSLQYAIREEVIAKSKDLFKNIGAKNPTNDIIDESIILSNGWQMYGSQKPSSEAYNLTHIYNVTIQYIDEIENTMSNRELIDLLSIRKKERFCEVNQAGDKIIKKNKKKIKRKYDKITNIRRRRASPKLKVSDENLKIYRKMVEILSKQRADDHNSWIRVGWCLMNIDYRMLEDWIKFSQKSEKSNIVSDSHGRSAERCIKEWDNFNAREDGVNVGSLYMWARTDNYEEYQRIIEEDINSILMESLKSGPKKIPTYDVAKAIYTMYKHQFVCASNKERLFFEFKDHRWRVVDNAVSLRKIMSTEVANKYRILAIKCNQEAIKGGDNSENFDTKSQTCASIIMKLKDQPFKEKITKELADLFYDKDFLDNLDSKKNLIGFNNGVYDLDVHEFREGLPEDCISFSTGIDYIDVVEGEDLEHYENMKTFLRQILPKESIRDYVLGRFSQCLHGDIGEELFHMWTGTGSNGKSKIIELFEKAYGDYCCKLPIALLTSKRAASNSASPELARTKGKRFGVLQEPSKGAEFNVGLMKELTGGDKISARALYKELKDFKPQFKLVLTCNDLPVMSKMDGGTRRRLRVVNFTSKFVLNPDPTIENQYQIDFELESKLDQWPELFMMHLIKVYKRYKRGEIKEPKEVMEVTQQYEDDCDEFKAFFDDMIVEDPKSSGLKLMLISTSFNLWYQKSGRGSSKRPPRKELREALEAKYGKYNRKVGWKGIALKSMFDNDMDDSDDDL